MNTFRTLAFATIAAGTTAEIISNGTPQGKVIEPLSVTAGDSTCDEPPKLCTGPVMMYGYATTLTYLCSETTTTKEPSTVHVTITKTTTVTPSEVEATVDPTGTFNMVAPAPALTEELDVMTTIRSTLTEYKTVTLFGNTNVPTPTESSLIPLIAITGYLSATIPTELLSSATSLPTETEEPVYTIQTSVPAATSSYNFPTILPPAVNGTTTGIFYSTALANSSAVRPTPFFPNTTSVHSRYTLPTLNVANRAAETPMNMEGAAGKAAVSSISLVFGIVMATLIA